MIDNDSFSGGRGGGLAIVAAQFFLPCVTFLMMIAVAFLAASIVSNEGDNPVAVLLLVTGVCLAVYALIRPWGAFLVFLWLAVTIDTFKRLTFATSSMSMNDVAYVLAVPVIVMAALYLRVALLQWFAHDSKIDRIQFAKFVPVMILLLLVFVGIIGKDGLSFANLSKNYTLLCYIPAAVVVPLLLTEPARWTKYSRHLFWITIVIGIYGLIQSWHGPFDFELTYLMSGLTATDNLIEADGRFRVFSLLNASSTFAGMMVIGTFYALYGLCVKYGRLQLKGWRTKAMIAFCFFVCFLATQRGAFVCGLLTVAMLPLFSRPRMLQVAFGVFVGLFILMVTHIDEVWYSVQQFDGELQSLNTSDFVQQNTSLLTFGARVQSFELLQASSTWTAFGQSGHLEIMSGHDLVTTLVLWIGWVGLLVFFTMTAGLLAISSKLLADLKHNPTAYLWAQVNLAVFFFIVIWSMLLGSVIHVSPMNFFFWFSIGNLLYMYKNERLIVRGPETAPTLPLAGPARGGLVGITPARPVLTGAAR